jgi:hypothetical protein
MVEYSCLLSYFSNGKIRIFFEFIKYDKFIKVIINRKTLIIKFENLKNHKLLFQYYIASLLCCFDYTEFSDEKDYLLVSALSTVKKWNVHILKFKKDIDYTFNKIYNSKEPTKETSIKKEIEFLNFLNFLCKIKLVSEPLILIKNFTELYILFITKMEYDILYYENKIYLLSCIRGINKDIYSNIRKFLYI